MRRRDWERDYEISLLSFSWQVSIGSQDGRECSANGTAAAASAAATAERQMRYNHDGVRVGVLNGKSSPRGNFAVVVYTDSHRAVATCK